MCGLAGCIDLHKQRRVEKSILVKMADAIVHRGPDSGGYFIDDNVGMAFRRLGIIDLQSGTQPIFNEDRSIVLICNGEIYNFVDLREELIARGHSFRSRTDVEVLVHLYEDHGTDFLKRLNGQFAFVIFDMKAETAFLARDQFGICPLYYTVSQGMLICASEIKAILQHPLAPRAVDLTGLDQTLTLPGPISPRTVFKGIQSLAPGNYLLAKNGDLRINEYWDLEYPQESDHGEVKSEKYYVNTLKELFSQSVRYRLQADVPVGFFLSGGLDSSMIAAMIHRISPAIQRHSFSICFSDQGICEAKYQHLIQRVVDSIHHEILFEDADIPSRLCDVVYHAESPLKETYNAASLALSKKTKESGIKVVLNGEGSDELFAGYVGYKFDKRRAAEAPKVDLDTVLGNELRVKMWGDPSLHYEKDEYAFHETKSILYAKDVSEHLAEFDCSNFPIVNRERLKGRHPVHKRSYLDFKLRLAGHLIADHGDRMAMANSVEARYPFLDINLVEFCRQIPPDAKLNGFVEKAILKKVAEGLVPPEIIEREKFGFVAPGTPSLLQRNTGWVYDQLSYDRIKRQGYFNPDTVEFLKSKYSTPGFTINQALEDDLLVVVLTFGLLMDLFNLPSLN